MKAFVRLMIVGLAFAAAFAPSAPAQTQKKSAKDLPPHHRKWIEEDAVYIIKPKERDVFLQLDSDREREMFIGAFWKARDPSPNSEKNEFREEHYRRITYANQTFGRDSPGLGWRSDMGRIYILLGEPKAIEKYENLPELYPTVIWFFEGMAHLGLPNAFNVVYFKRSGINEYVLYSPVRHGPQNLLVHYEGDMTEYQSALAEIYKVEPNIAEVALTLLPGEARATLSPSISSEILINQKIPAAAYERIKDEYAEKLLRYRNIIEVDYSANYIESEAMVRVYRDALGTAFVHYLLEPSRLTFDQSDTGFIAEIEVDAKVDDERGRTIFQFQRVSPINMTPSQISSIRGKLFSFQDLFPLIPGRYTLNILLKNRTSREFTSFETDLLVPDPGVFSMSAPVLANKADPNSRFRGQNKPFLLGDIQLVPSPRNDFQIGETGHLFFQLFNPPADVREGGRIDYGVFKEAEKIASISRPLADLSDRTNIHQEFPLAGYAPAHYTIRVAVISASGAERLTADVPFFITPMLALPRPFLMSMTQPPSDSPAGVHARGLQHLNAGDFDRARPLLESAHRSAPAEISYALDYVRLLAEAGDPAGVKAVAGPFLADERRYDFLEYAGRAFQALDELPQAIALYKDYLAHFGTHIEILNAVGECHARLGQNGDALVAWEKSLELEPNQPALKEKVRILKEKK